MTESPATGQQRVDNKAASATEQPTGPRLVDDSQYHSALYNLHHNPDSIRDLFKEGIYPYKTRLKRGPYEKKKRELQAELLKAQNWIKETGQRFMLLFEGRDAAGKGGTIKRFMEHMNPRSARVVALEKTHRY